MGAATIVRDGAEVRQETGLGRVAKVEHEAGKRNAHVEVKAEHLQHPVKGWVDTQGPAWPIVQAAYADDRRVSYVVEVTRRRGVDASIPLDELDRTDKLRDLAWLAIVDRDGNIVDAAGDPPAGGAAAPRQEPQERPQTAPTPESRGQAPDSPQRPEEAPTATLYECPVDGCAVFPYEDPEELAAHLRAQHGIGNDEPTADGKPDVKRPCARCGAELVGQRSVRPDPEAGGMVCGDGCRTDPRGPAPRAARIAEAKPWEPTNSDGTLNLGSYAVTASVGMVEYAYELAQRHALDVGIDETAGPVDFVVVRALARRLLTAADAVQAAVRRDGHVDRMDASHTRARGAVHTVVDAIGFPWGASREVVDTWHAEVIDHATQLVALGIALVDPEPRG